MAERQIVEKTVRPDGSNERIEICLGGVVHVLSLEKGEEIARQTLSLLGINVARLEVENEKLQRLIMYAGGILAHGTPGSAWMDWIMRVQGVLGARFHEERFGDGNGMPFRELEDMVKDMPRVSIRRLKALGGE